MLERVSPHFVVVVCESRSYRYEAIGPAVIACEGVAIVVLCSTHVPTVAIHSDHTTRSCVLAMEFLGISLLLLVSDMLRVRVSECRVSECRPKFVE